MDGMLSLFETVSQYNCNDTILQKFLKTCTENKTFLNKATVVIQPVVANINNKLNASATRYDGLLLLKTFLPQCSVQIFGENVISWMQQCIKSIERGQNNHALASISYQVLKLLLEMSEQMPEMKRVVSGFVVTKIIDNFQQIVPQEASLSMLECLEVLMCNYGPSCGQQKNVLEKCVLQYVDSADVIVINSAARCVAFLPLLGGGGSQGANHVSRWKQQQQKVCTTLHCILDELFDNVREIPNCHSSLASCGTLSLPATSEIVPLLRMYQLMTRFINISKFLQAMLISEFPVEKAVLPDEIFGVVCRGLAVTSHTMENKVSTDLLMVGAMMPQIHVALLKVLDSLIMCCGRNLLPYAPVICKLVLQTLKWTSAEKWAYGIEKPYGQLRVTACNTLILWLQTSNCGSCVELISEELTSVLMQDIWFEKEAVTLNVQGTYSKKKNKHKQHKPEQQQQQEQQKDVWNSIKYIPDQKANSKTCRATLQVLQWMLHSAAAFIKPSTHRLLQEATVELLFNIQRTSKVHDIPIPYGESSCRLELYRLLHTLVLEPHATWPPPTQFAVHMLSAGRSDPDLEVSSFCTAALTALEKLIHPASGTLNFPVSLEEMLESTKRYKQEYPTKAKDTSEEEEVNNYVHKRGGSGGSKQTDAYRASNSSEEVVLVCENRMQKDDEEISECEVVSLYSEESDSSVKNKATESHGLSEVVSKTHNKLEVSLVDIFDSDDEYQHKEVQSASFIDISVENGSCSNVGNSKNGLSQNCKSKVDNKIQSATPIHINKESPHIKSKNKIGTSGDLSNEDKLISNQQKGTTESYADASNRCENIICALTEKGSKEISENTKICTAKRTVLVTENEEERENNDFVLHVQEDDHEPNPKKIKLDSPGSSTKYYKPNTETTKTNSHSNVKNSTAVPIAGNEEQVVNGVAVNPKDVTEEEMLQTFVDVLSD